MSRVDDSIGARISVIRKRQGMSQQRLAAEAHVSKSLLSKVEAGWRPATPAFTATVARALGVDVVELTQQPYRGPQAREERLHQAIPSLRRSLLTSDFPDEDVRPRGLDELRSEVEQVSRLGRAARYIELSVLLPALLDELHAALHGGGVERERGYALLAEAYSGVSVIAYAFGYVDLRSIALDRIDSAARASGDPLRVARTQWSKGASLQATGAYRQGLVLMERTRADIGSDLGGMDPPTLSVYGVLHLRSAVLAARANDGATAWAHHAEASDAARLLGEERNDYGVEFGPSNVAIHSVALPVELGDGTTAIQRAEGMILPSTVPPVRVGRHYIDVARGYLMHGDRQRCLHALLAAERHAPQQARNHPSVREMVGTLVRLDRAGKRNLLGLARRVGL